MIQPEPPSPEAPPQSDVTVAPKPAPPPPRKPKNVNDEDYTVATLSKQIDPKLFGYDQARHLLWRAGFGGTEAQIQTLVKWGPRKSVDHLLEYQQVNFDEPKSDTFDKSIMHPPTQEEREMAAVARRSQDEDKLAKYRLMRQQAERDDRLQMAEVQKWWLKRMIETPRPLEERMTLFWHGHFATSFRGVEDSYHMFLQNQLFRKHAVGSYGDLLFAIIRDPAMIKYLNNDQSRKGHPNENLAREIMELFSLGVGNYSEKDIKEGARALTGYTYDDDDFVYQRQNHDTGAKNILGKEGSMDGDDFVRAILEQRACSAYITRKLYNFFVADVPPDERGGDKELDPAQKAVLHEMASALLTSRYDLKPVLRKLFMSEHFYQRAFINQQIKSPVQLVVGAVRSLNTPVRDLSILVDALDLMGQRIFMPPSVKGWDGGRSWINTSTVFVRQNILTFLLTGKKPQGYDSSANTDRFDALAILPADANGPEEVVSAVLRVTLGQQPTAARDALLGFLKENNDIIDNKTVTGLTLLATAMPEYQLC
jgi:uncharacterized protein (DUF1800 family)